jgi:type VI secretion system protein ImpB
MPESTQHKLDRIRPPRVQITYDVETRGSFVKVELPFVVGILADLSGNVDDPARPRRALRDRKYVEIDRDNFNDIMKSIGPNVQTNGGSKPLSFQEIDDFSPIKVLKKLEVNDRYLKRTYLSDMATKLDGNVKLQESLLAKILNDTDREALKKALADIKKAIAPPPPENTPKPPETPSEGEGGKN